MSNGNGKQEVLVAEGSIPFVSKPRELETGPRGGLFLEPLGTALSLTIFCSSHTNNTLPVEEKWLKHFLGEYLCGFGLFAFPSECEGAPSPP